MKDFTNLLTATPILPVIIAILRDRHRADRQPHVLELGSITSPELSKLISASQGQIKHGALRTRNLVLTSAFDQFRNGTLRQLLLKGPNSVKIRITANALHEDVASAGADDDSGIVHRIVLCRLHHPESDDCRVIAGKEPFCVFWSMSVS